MSNEQPGTSLTRSVAANTLYQSLGRAVSLLLSLAVFFLVARYLDVEGYGLYTTVTAFLQFFGIVVDLGLYIYLANKLGEPGIDEARTVGNVFTIRLVSAAVLIGLAPLVVLAFPYPGIVKSGVAVMSLSFFFVTMTQVLAGVFQKRLHMSKFIGAEVIGRVVLLIVTVLAIRAGVGFLGVMWTVVVSSALIFVLTLSWARSFIPFRLRFDRPIWFTIIRTTWPIALSIMFNVIYFKADTIILSLLKEPADVGIYGAPYRIFEALISLPAMFAGLLTPILSRAYATDRPRFARMLQKGFEALLAAAVPLVVGTQFVAGSVMALLSHRFSASGPVLQILVFGSAAIFIGYLFSNVVVVVNKQRVMMWVYLAVALSSIGLYLLFIPPYSYFGAAYTTVLVESVVAAMATIVVLRTARVRFTYDNVIKILLSGLAMAAVMWAGRSLPWFVNGALGVIAYSLALIMFRVIDRATLREVVGRTGA